LLCAVGVVITAALVAALWPFVQIYVGVRPPDQFYRALDPPLVSSVGRVLGIAHNAGNNPVTTVAALRHGAAVVEIDVIMARGELVAGRDQPVPRVAAALFRGYTLEQMWALAAPADIIKLDLKQSDQSFLDDVASFLSSRQGTRPIMVSSGSPEAIRDLHRRLPKVTMLFSIGNPEAWAALRADPSLVRAIGGVSVFQGLVDPVLVGWMHDRGLLVLAWTVNDAARLNELVRMRVDGVTMANLAILEALSRTS